MKQTLASFGLVALVTLTPAMASAACYAEYKAKRETPFSLIYNVAKINGSCTVESARRELSARLSRQGLILLKVLSVSKN